MGVLRWSAMVNWPTWSPVRGRAAILVIVERNVTAQASFRRRTAPSTRGQLAAKRRPSAAHRQISACSVAEMTTAP